MSEGFLSHVHLDSTERSKLLSRLDEADARQPGHDKRRWKRWEYRMSDIALIVQHPGGGSGRFLVCARNISAGGISFIHGGYVHPGSECRILLPRRDGTPLLVAGVVVHCRHVESNHHEVGIRFLQEIDPAAILPSASADEAAADQTLELPTVEGQVVVVDQSDTDRRLMMHHLGATGLTLQMVESTGAALDVLRQRSVDLVLCDLNLADDAVRMIEQMRSLEYRGPIIVVTAENDPVRLAKARKAGANEIIGRPYNPLYLASLLAEWLQAPAPDRPIYSTLEEKPGMAELIADFIEEAGRQAHELRKALAAGDLELTRSACLALAGSGSGFGFEPVTEAARDSLTALDTSQEREQAEGPLRRLVGICERLCCGSSVRPTGAGSPKE